MPRAVAKAAASRLHPKVVASTATASAAAVLVAFVLHVPGPVADAIVVLGAFLGGWARRA